MIEIREAARNDAEQLAEVMKNAEESGYMLFDPGEREIVLESFAAFIEATNQQEKSRIFIVCEKKRIIGYLIARSEKPKRISHRAHLVIGIHSDSRGKGIGKALFLHMLDWAKKVNLHRLDLTVVAGNEAAVALYKKMGFEIEGVKRDSLVINNHYVDEYYMSKLI
ncbi:GNAT family N-acetyltransferase [Planococcus shenhongbingii]|uniref:GNAT family N-acetyltransferase n=1 Tax=Planococcus shenhongbingii TaxID=3058398 RepID=UPI0034619307